MSRSCPICQSKEKKVLSKLCGNMSIMGRQFPQCSSNNVFCKKCGCVYVDSNAVQNDFTQYYRSDMSKGIDYYTMFGVKQTQEYYQHIYDSIKPYVNKDSHILDMGCGLGDFSKFLVNIGYENVTAMDPSTRNISIVKGKNITCFEGDCFEFPSKLKGKFDIVILSHVLEHIWDMRVALENVKSMLKAGGVLYIETPDASKYADVDFPPYFFFTYEHVTHYVPDTLLNIEKTFGLKIIQKGEYLKCESYYVLYGIFSKGQVVNELCYSDVARLAIHNYSQISKNRLCAFVSRLEESQEEIILWGIGASTAQLLSETFDQCRVTQLIDNNLTRQGLAFMVGNKVLYTAPPESISKESNAIILILPTMYKDSIRQQIREMGFRNRVIALE